MTKHNDAGDVSIGYWMMALLISWIPLVNLVAVPILAFCAGDRTKRNFYRALIVWFLVVVLLQIALLLTGVLTGALAGLLTMILEQLKNMQAAQ
ncbi:MAG: hypothetical protein LBI02_05510 [Opitutaceae bacterium]|nr:hypothetical protein [Opitutaceae bacterium]